MKRLSGVRLQVCDPETLAGFYSRMLGMNVWRADDHWRLGYDGADADLLLYPSGQPVRSERDQKYWKIGICLPNLDLACEKLRAAGVDVSAPRQFSDIGYMAHLSDPEGFSIELLQHHFDGNRPAGSGDPGLTLG